MPAMTWPKEGKQTVLWLITLLLIVASWAFLYAAFGHRLIQAMYEGKALGVLNRIIEGQGVHPVEFYLHETDQIFYAILYSLPFLANILLLVLNPTLAISWPLGRRQFAQHTDDIDALSS